ncbi:arginine--tRNA ligase [bacterium]|nr:arginine--tRNA ligase [bacterium]
MRIAYEQILSALSRCLAERGFEGLEAQLSAIEEPRPWGVSSNVCFTLAPRIAASRIEAASAGLSKAEAKKLAIDLGREAGVQLASELALELQQLCSQGCFPYIERVEAEGPYLNFYYDAAALAHMITGTVRVMDERFGQGICSGMQPGDECYRGYDCMPRRIMVEYAQPNTHKDFHVGHLRNASIGQAIANLLEFQGHTVYKATYLGDVGLHVAKAMWGAAHAQELGVAPAASDAPQDRLAFWGRCYKAANARFEAEGGEAVQAEVRAWLAHWEEGSVEARSQWQSSRDECDRAFRDIFAELLVDFTADPNCWFYESIVDDTRLGQKTAEELKRRGIAQVDESEKYAGSLYVHFEEHLGRLLPGEIRARETALGRELREGERAELEAQLGKTLRRLGKMVILRSDGTSLYQTKELGLAKHKFDLVREKTGEPLAESLYVVGAEQKLYFEQVFSILKLWGFPNAENCRHISYELVVLPEGKMSSREGTVVSYRELKDEAVRRAEEIIREKGLITEEQQIQETARKVALAAIKFTMLQVGGNQQIVFDFEQALSFDGRAAPYLQYAYARAGKLTAGASLEQGGNGIQPTAVHELHASEIALARWLSSFPSVCQTAAERFEPAGLCNYLYSLAAAFSDFYRDCRVIDAPQPERAFRQGLCEAFRTVLRTGFRLLALPLPEAM